MDDEITCRHSTKKTKKISVLDGPGTDTGTWNQPKVMDMTRELKGLENLVSHSQRWASFRSRDAAFKQVSVSRSMQRGASTPRHSHLYLCLPPVALT